MKTIQLNKGARALISNSDFKRVSRFKWYLWTRNGLSYAYRWVKRGNIDTTEKLHNFIKTPPPGKEWDHRDGNGLNNRRRNLRAASRSENNANNRGWGELGVKGVTRQSNPNSTRPFFVRCRRNGVVHYGGSFASLSAAGRSYNALAKKLFGQFARLNRI